MTIGSVDIEVLGVVLQMLVSKGTRNWPDQSCHKSVDRPILCTLEILIDDLKDLLWNGMSGSLIHRINSFTEDNVLLENGKIGERKIRSNTFIPVVEMAGATFFFIKEQGNNFSCVFSISLPISQ